MSLWPLLLCASLALSVSAACGRRTPPPAAPVPLPPQVSGTLTVDGLTAPVRVVRDRWGVPHIYAGNQDDLFFAQGFVQAQDRLFQMDLWRRSVQGRLSEVLGSNFLERDAMTRRMQYRGDMRAEWASYGPDTEAIATAFVRGVNAWVDLALAQLPEEFTYAGWRPERWTAQDLLNRTDAFVASSNAIDEVLRARLIAAVGPRQADALLPPPAGAPTVVPRGLELATISPVIVDAVRRVGPPPFFSGLAVAVMAGRTVADAAGTSAIRRSTDAAIEPSTVRLPAGRSVRARKQRVGRDQRPIGDRCATARDRSASPARPSIRPLSGASERARLERHRRGCALETWRGDRPQRAPRVGDDES